MELQINQWGNSLGMRLPKALSEMLGVSSGSTVHAQIVSGKLVISSDPLERLKVMTINYSLEELLAQMPADYDPCTDEELRAWRNAPPVGKEIIDDDWS